MDVSKYRQLYLDECREHLQALNRELLALEQAGGSGGVDEMFRAAHSVKGMSGSMGYDDVVLVSHALEDILDRLRRDGTNVKEDLLALLYEGVDTLGALVDEIEEGLESRLAVDGIVVRLREAAAGAAPRTSDVGGDLIKTGTPAVADQAEDEASASPVVEPEDDRPVVALEASDVEPSVDSEPPEDPESTEDVEPLEDPEASDKPEQGGDAEQPWDAEPMEDAEPPAEVIPDEDIGEAGEAGAESAEGSGVSSPAVPETVAAHESDDLLAGVDGALVETEGAAADSEATPGEQREPVAGAPAPFEDLVAARGEIFTLEPEKLAMVRDFVRSGLVPYACRLRVARDSAALAARNFIILGRLSKTGMLLASTPTIEEVRGGHSREVVEALLLTERSEDDLRAQLLSIPELEELQVRRLKIGVDSGTAGGKTPTAPALLQPRETVTDRPAGGGGRLADRYAPKKASTVRVDTRVLDDLINIVGELIITRERLHEIGRELESEELHVNLDRLHTLVRDFQDSIMTVRMMPLELVTDRLPRIVRDLAHSGGKKVAFEVAGKGIELDRAILEELNDVLIHLVRNAIDHGIEIPEERKVGDKPEKALIRLRAGRERDWVWVRIEDDGRGMDPESIARAAIERGLVSAAKVAEMGEREKIMLCCFPGVSTADRVSEVSGRGVGMDVVKAKIDAFGGTLQIESRPGRGTAITLRLPLTLAIIRILLVGVRGQEYGLPVSHVIRTSPLEPGQVEWSQKKPLLRHGGRLVPLLDLGAILGLPPRDLRSQAGLFVTVAEFGDRAAGLAVDRLLGTYEVVIKPLGPPLKRVRGLGGVTVMGDGRTVLLLDLAALI